MSVSQRHYYRIPYPVGDRPFIDCQFGRYSVVNISEGGAMLEGPVVIPKDQKIEGTVDFPSGHKVRVVGHVIRVHEGQMVVQFKQGVPLGVIIEEQRRLIKRYGTLQGIDG